MAGIGLTIRGWDHRAKGILNPCEMNSRGFFVELKSSSCE